MTQIHRSTNDVSRGVSIRKPEKAKKHFYLTYWFLAIIAVIGISIISLVAVMHEVPGLFLPLLIAPAVVFAITIARQNSRMLLIHQQYAEANHFVFSPVGEREAETGVLFRYSPKGRISRVVQARLNSQPIRFFRFDTYPDTSLSRRDHNQAYTVFSTVIKGRFPNLLFDRIAHVPSEKVGRAYPLPYAVAKSYRLYGPPEYEIEALALFTPDVLEQLAALDVKFDLEIASPNVYVYTQYGVHSTEDLERRLATFQRVLAILNHHKLNIGTFAPIGNLPHHLTKRRISRWVLLSYIFIVLFYMFELFVIYLTKLS